MVELPAPMGVGSTEAKLGVDSNRVSQLSKEKTDDMVKQMGDKLRQSKEGVHEDEGCTDEN